MGYINGVNLLPATGEFTYGTTVRVGQRVNEPSASGLNFFYAGGPPKTDYSYSMDQLQAGFPSCTTVALIVAWFFNSRTAGSCQIYPATTYINNGTIIDPATGLPWPTLSHAFQYWNGSAYTPDQWRVSSLNETSSGLVPISSNGGTFTYGGTPSDQSVVECIRDLKTRGFRVVFYPFLLGDIPGDFPWRGRITYSPSGALPDITSAASAAVAAFLGSASIGQFTQDFTNETVAYSGSPTDFSYRRMILHYANLCVVAGGVDLFLIGSELRGLETIRGPSWTPAGSGNPATWDYPFVNGLMRLSDDVRSVLDAAGYTKNLATLKNLVSYAADWSVWMGVQHNASNPPNNGQWPHLDQLYAHTNIDLVCFDNYMPLSDWTTAPNGLDILHWSDPKPSGAWPPPSGTMNGLGLTGTPTIYSKQYLKANIEGGQYFDWFYYDSTNLGRGADPNGSILQVSIPQGERLTQSRNSYNSGQELLANKQIRWWWNNTHRAVYDTGSGEVPQGNPSQWVAQSKSIAFTEYGFPTVDRCTNQPNVFFDPKSSESFTPFWSAWDPADGGTYIPHVDAVLAQLALEAVYEYWFSDTPSNNQTSAAGVVMLLQAFCSVWNWDARPFPTFPQLTTNWGDSANWRAGNWISGKGPFVPPVLPDTPPGPGTWGAFPVLAGQGWLVRYTPIFVSNVEVHVSGRQSTAARVADPWLEIEITYDVLRMESVAELQTLVGFYDEARGSATPFTISIPAALGFGSSVTARFMDEQLDVEEFMSRLWRGESLKIRQVKGD